MEENRIYIEYIGAYDGWLIWEDKQTGDRFHRNNNSKILEMKTPVEYGPVYFKTEAGNFYKNLTPISEEEYEKQPKGQASLNIS